MLINKTLKLFSLNTILSTLFNKPRSHFYDVLFFIPPNMKIKTGLIVGFNGNGFHGLQYNIGVKTVESEVIIALLQSNLIKKENSNDPKKICLHRSSRTDKGVHAAFLLITCKIEKEITNEIQTQLKNSLLKSNIYLYKMIRLPGGFNPKKKCNSRIYEYIIPTFVLNDTFDLSSRIKLENFELLKNLLKKYEGTKKYHNFTISSNIKGTQRFIKNMTISDPYVVDDIEYIKVTLHGNSFLLHQIRKMIGFVLTIIKFARERIDDIFERAFMDERINIPKAPSEFLLLDQPVFTFYNNNPQYEKIEIDEEEKNKVKNKFVYPEIYRQENLEIFKNWFDVFVNHFYEFEYLK